VNPKPHLVFHCIILAALFVVGAVVLTAGSIQFRWRQVADCFPFALALFFAAFGIWKTARYSRSIANGCELTVTTAEALIFPYLGYFCCVVLALVSVLTRSLR
jgi:hypothetical protein